MALYLEQIIGKFMHKYFPAINRKADYQSIHDIWTLLYGNTSTVTTVMVGGNHGHIRFIMEDTIYMKILPTPYDVTVDPGGTAEVPLQATTSKHSQLRDKTAEACCINDNHQNMDMFLKTMVLDMIDNTYVFALHNVIWDTWGHWRNI